MDLLCTLSLPTQSFKARSMRGPSCLCSRPRMERFQPMSPHSCSGRAHGCLTPKQLPSARSWGSNICGKCSLLKQVLDLTNHSTKTPAPWQEHPEKGFEFELSSDQEIVVLEDRDQGLLGCFFVVKPNKGNVITGDPFTFWIIVNVNHKYHLIHPPHINNPLLSIPKYVWILHHHQAFNDKGQGIAQNERCLKKYSNIPARILWASPHCEKYPYDS